MTNKIMKKEEAMTQAFCCKGGPEGLKYQGSF